MGKVFITDEVNDNYTADVTNAGKLEVETGAAEFTLLSGNRLAVDGTATAQTTVPTYLKSIIVGSKPLTSTWMSVYDVTVSVSGNGLSGFGTTSDNIVSRILLDSSAGACATHAAYPKVIPFDVYLASGLCITLGEGTTFSILSGNCSGITAIYQT